MPLYFYVIAMTKISSYLKLLRPRHWIKNAFILTPLLFAGRLYDEQAWIRILVAVVSFCCIASAGYIVNDVMDLEKDRLHPTKKNRPIASGIISIRQAYVLASVLLVTSLGLAKGLSDANVLIVASYAVLMFFYSKGLKRVPILDLAIIGFGFVLRILAGGFAISVPTSLWILGCTVSVAFLLGLGKRIAELHQVKGAHTRSTLGFYTTSRTVWLERIFSVLSILLYSAYVIRVHPHPIMFLSIVPVAAGILRYSYLLTRVDVEGPTELLLKDYFLQLSGVAWVVLATIGIAV